MCTMIYINILERTDVSFEKSSENIAGLYTIHGVFVGFL